MKEIEWRYLGSWRNNILSASCYVDHGDAGVFARHNLPRAIIGYKVVVDDVYVGKEQYKLTENFFYSKVASKDWAYLSDFVSAAQATTRDFLNAGYDFNSLDSFKLFTEKLSPMVTYWVRVIEADSGIEKAIVEKCQAEGVEIYTALAQVNPPNLEFTAKNNQLAKLAKKYKNKQLHDSEVDDFIKKYAWTGVTAFFGDPYNKKKLLVELAAFQAPLKPNVEALGLDWPELKVAENFAFLRFHFAESLGQIAFQFRPLLEAIGKSNGLTFEEIGLHSCRELIAGQIKPRQVLRERMKKYAVIVIDGNEEISSGSKAASEAEPFSTVTAQGELRGLPASPGTVRGIAKIVLSSAEMYKVKPGDILIAVETTPDYVPIMKIAGAIVTNQGGVTSHAAIISRELGVPCVIGTKIATKVLKDGDKVEVDAVKGIVRKL